MTYAESEVHIYFLDKKKWGHFETVSLLNKKNSQPQVNFRSFYIEKRVYLTFCVQKVYKHINFVVINFVALNSNCPQPCYLWNCILWVPHFKVLVWFEWVKTKLKLLSQKITCFIQADGLSVIKKILSMYHNHTSANSLEIWFQDCTWKYTRMVGQT